HLHPGNGAGGADSRLGGDGAFAALVALWTGSPGLFQSIGTTAGADHGWVDLQSAGFTRLRGGRGIFCVGPRSAEHAECGDEWEPSLSCIRFFQCLLWFGL